MIGTARSVATALHERPALFDSQSAFLKTVRPGTDLYAPPIPTAIQLDGVFNDWESVWDVSKQYNSDQVVTWFDPTLTANDVSLSFTHMVGRYGKYYYAMFDVTDDVVVWRAKNALAVDQSDHLLISVIAKDDTLQRFIIAPYEAGWVNAYQLDTNDINYRAIGNELQIQGRWQQTDKGYAIELRFPLTMTSGALAFALVDVDSAEHRVKKYAVGTANPNDAKGLGTVLTPSPEIERILSGLKYANSRVWVVDNHKRVLARAGDIHSASGFKVPATQKSDYAWWNWVEGKILLPLYYHILTRPPAAFVDELETAYALAGMDITKALNGEADSLWRLTPDKKAVILSAAYPIFIGDNVMGAVVVEQTTNGIRTLRNRALEQLFHVILAVMLLGTLSLFLFANRISNRVRKLRDNTEAVIDDNGKIIGSLPQPGHIDEIDDLHRSFCDVLVRLQQYNSYLENMASRLSHELRTPIAIVRSSLDTICEVNDPTQQALLIERAQSGITRLSTILNSMSEATRLEHAIAQEEPETFDVAPVVSGCIDGYAHVFRDRQFELKMPLDSAHVKGSPDLFAQMMDKIIANAVEFSHLRDTIVVHLWRESKTMKLSVTNPGPPLPEGMKSQLLQSMVSVRPDEDRHKTAAHPHLGLGLFIASMIANYHKGQIQLSDLPDKTGVCVVVTFPLVNT